MAREQERAPQAHGTESTNAGAPSDAIYDARVLGLPKMGLLGVQHLFAMFGATVLVPLLTGLSVSSILYGMISAVGVRNLVEHQVDFSKPRNMLICAVSIVCTLGISFSKAGAVAFDLGTAKISLSGLAVGALIGIFLNAALPGKDYAFSETEPNMKDPERFGGPKAGK